MTTVTTSSALLSTTTLSTMLNTFNKGTVADHFVQNESNKPMSCVFIAPLVVSAIVVFAVCPINRCRQRVKVIQPI